MKSIMYDVVIIGAGPSGVTTYYRLLQIKFWNVLLIDKDIDYCSSVKKYNTFYKNINSRQIPGYDHLLDGTKTGIDIYDFFHNKYGDNLTVKAFCVDRIEKEANFFHLYDVDGKIIQTKKVILATGVKIKKIKLLTSGNITFIDKNEIKEKADKNNCEIIFIGSGDNVAIKSIKMCKLYENTEQESARIKIIARDFFFKKINPCFHDDLKYFEKKGLLQIIYTNEKITEFNYTTSGFVKKIIFEKFIYKTKEYSGALVGVYIGFEKNIPHLTNCLEKDLIMVGDIDSLHSKKTLSLTDAIYSVKLAMKKLLD